MVILSTGAKPGGMGISQKKEEKELTNATTRLRRCMALCIAALTVLCLLPALPAQAITGDHVVVAEYQPAGYENLSHMIYDQYPLEASSHGTFFQLNAENTAPLYDWKLDWLCDDDLDAGWSTAFDEGIMDPALSLIHI